VQVWRRWSYWKGVKIVNTDQTLVEIRGLARLLHGHWDCIRNYGQSRADRCSGDQPLGLKERESDFQCARSWPSWQLL